MGQENKLGTEKIFKLVLQIAIPSMLAQFVSVLYSIIDRIFVGNIAEIGGFALGGIGVCAPILTFVAAFSVFVGIGGGPLLGIALGEKNKDKARKILANAFVMLIGIGILVTIICLATMKPLLMLCGASDVTYPYAKTYFMICISGITFQLLSQGMYQFVIAQGYAKTGMASIILGAILNIALDPLFIFVFHMGIAGAALATILSQAASMVFVLIFLFFKSDIKITFKNYSFKTMGNIAKLGISPFLIIGLDAVMLIAVNAMLKQCGGDNADFLITVNTIVQSFMLVITMPLGGITGGTQCILAYNYGAGNKERVMQAQKVIMLVGLIYCTIFFIIARLGGGLFISLFSNDKEIMEVSKTAINVSTLMIIPLAIQYEIVDGYTGMGQVKLSCFLSLFRKAIYFIAVFTIPVFGNVDWIFYAEPISDLASICMSGPCYFLFINKILNRRVAYVKGIETTAQ